MEYLNFDYHHFCKGDNYGNVKMCIDKIRDRIKSYGIYEEDLKAKKVV